MNHLDQKCATKGCNNKAGDIDDCLYLNDDGEWVCGPCLAETELEKLEADN